MNKYEFNSAIYECNFQVKYSKSGVLVGFEVMNDDGLAIQKIAKILDVCLLEKPFLDYMKSKKVVVTKIQTDLSFENFWITYNYKVGRKKAEQKWDKLSQNNKSLALTFIQRYKQRKNSEGTAMLYPATYLNEEPWNDNK